MTTAARHREAPRSDGVPHPFKGLLYPGRGFGRWVLRRYWDIQVHHGDRFPAGGPVVVAANHIGFIDGPLMGIFSPRPVHAWTKREMFAGAMRPVMHLVGQIPIDRFHPDPRAVRIALRVLRDGGAVGVFPEGRRGNGELGRFHRGAAYLAMVAGAPVVPLTFIGTREPGGGSGSLPARGARIDLVFGHPIAVPATQFPRTRDAVTSMSLLLHERMLAEVHTALAETGRTLPGPLPPGQTEPDSGDDVTEERPA
ncbi:MAG TPA: lysophospholipid acyltransferase family protein [Nocardioides sp.]|nr:lysophospholipid acyltransferase family protein [Nocardioides sp.]